MAFTISLQKTDFAQNKRIHRSKAISNVSSVTSPLLLKRYKKPKMDID